MDKKYIDELNKYGIDLNIVKECLNNYIDKNGVNSKDEHVINLNNDFSLKIKFKSNKNKVKLNKKDKSFNIEDYIEIDLYNNKNKINLKDKLGFIEDFKPQFRSLATVYIVGNPNAFPLSAVGSSVKAQITSDFVESLLSGAEGTITSTANAGDSNIPLQSIADIAAVLSKNIIETSSQLGIDTIIPVPNIYTTLQSINKTSIYQVVAPNQDFQDDPFNGSGLDVDGSLILSYADGRVVPIFQLYYYNEDSGVIYMRCRSSETSTTMTDWIRVVNQTLLVSSILTSVQPLYQAIVNINTGTLPVYGAFLSEDSSNGIPITSVGSSYPCYIGNGQIVYRNGIAGGKLYLKSATGTDNGTAITSVDSYNPCYIGNGQIVYMNYSDGKLYVKSATGTDNGTAITSVISYSPCYIGNGQIVYRNRSDDKLYLKSATGTDNGTAITSTPSYYPCYIGDGQIVYSNDFDGGKLYLKSSTGTDNGTAITSVRSDSLCYIGNGQIVYQNSSDLGKLYIKSSTGTGNGIDITSVSTYEPCYIGNGQVVYVDENTSFLRLKSLFLYK